MASVGLIYDRLTSDEEEIILEAEKRGVEVRYLFVKTPVSRYLDGRRVQGLTVGFNRCESKSRALEAGRIVEAEGVPLVNPYRVERICADKIETLRMWSSRGVDTPSWVYIPFTSSRGFSEEEVERIASKVELLGYPLVVKPTMGSWGRGVVKVEGREELLRALAGASASSINPGGFFAQEYVEKPGFDLRILVGLKPRGGLRVLCGIARVSPTRTEFRTNTHLGGIPVGLNLEGQPRLVNEALEAGRILLEGCRWGVVALDVMPDARGLDYGEIFEYVPVCREAFQPIRRFVREQGRRRYRLWRERLEQLFAEYKSSEAYRRVEELVHELLGLCRLRWHEANSRFDYAVNTRNASGFNPASFYLDIAEELA